jgi:hypothetical protein
VTVAAKLKLIEVARLVGVDKVAERQMFMDLPVARILAELTAEELAEIGRDLWLQEEVRRGIKSKFAAAPASTLVPDAAFHAQLEWERTHEARELRREAHRGESERIRVTEQGEERGGRAATPAVRNNTAHVQALKARPVSKHY